MDKEKILEMSRKENMNVDLYELEIIGGTIAGILCFAPYLAEEIITGNKNSSLWGIFCTFIAVDSLYKGIKLKKKSSIIFGVVWLCIAIVSVTKAVITFVNTGRT
ncbi:MAG: hypothetical protein J6A57_05215 [Ruminococcus sp.]|nr:hypothetical protein [Ruminococcus sp.]